MANWPVQYNPFEGGSTWLGNITDLVFYDISEYYSLTVEFQAELRINNVTSKTVSFNETYFPDSAGKVRVSNLKDFIRPLFHPILSQDPYTGVYNDTLVRISFTYTLHREPGTDSSTATETGEVYFSQGQVSQADPHYFPYLLTQARERHSSPTRYELLTVPNKKFNGSNYNSYTRTLGIAYDLNGVPTWISQTYHPSTAYGFSVLNMSARAVLDELGLSSIDESQALYSEVTLLDDNSNPVDRCRFIYDQCDSERDTTLIFKNYFGFPETLTCSGAATEEISLESTFAWLGDEYGKYDDELILTNTVSTGFLNKEKEAMLKDLVHSPSVWLAEPLKHGEDSPETKKITITDIQASRQRVSREIQSARLSFRYAEKAYREPLIDIAEEITRARIFDGSFDNSFE